MFSAKVRSLFAMSERGVISCERMATTLAPLRIRRRARHRRMRPVSREEFDGVQRDIRVLRSFLVSVAGEDREGAYRPEFVRAVLTASTERPTRKFRGADHFLREIGKL